jgi:hypothetical protein
VVLVVLAVLSAASGVAGAAQLGYGQPVVAGAVLLSVAGAALVCANRLVVLGLVLAAVAPTGFFYLPNLACLVAAVVVAVGHLGRRRPR